jgi:hypothetical protein
VRHVAHAFEHYEIRGWQCRRQETGVDFRRHHRISIAGDNYRRRAKISVAPDLRGNEIFKQREITRVSVERFRPQYQPDRSTVDIVRRDRLGLKHGAQGAINQKHPERVDERA